MLLFNAVEDVLGESIAAQAAPMKLGVGQPGEPLIEAGRSVVIRARSNPICGADGYSSECAPSSFGQISVRNKPISWHGNPLPHAFH